MSGEVAVDDEIVFSTQSSAVRSMVEHVANSLICARDNAYPNEAVGYVCSDATLYPLINQARSPRRFEVSDTLIKEAIEEILRDGVEPAMIYHSHPTSDSTPSNRDKLMMVELVGAVFVIVGKDDISAWCYKDEPINGVRKTHPTLIFNMLNPT